MLIGGWVGASNSAKKLTFPPSNHIFSCRHRVWGKLNRWPCLWYILSEIFPQSNSSIRGRRVRSFSVWLWSDSQVWSSSPEAPVISLNEAYCSLVDAAADQRDYKNGHLWTAFRHLMQCIDHVLKSIFSKVDTTSKAMEVHLSVK